APANAIVFRRPSWYISHQYCAARAAEILDRDLKDLRPNYGIIEELRGIVNDEVVIEVRAYVRHGIDVPVLVGVPELSNSFDKHHHAADGVAAADEGLAGGAARDRR